MTGDITLSKLPTIEDLADSLRKAGEAHHEYEQNYLKGNRDEQWPGFYAAYVIGQIGGFMTPTELTVLLENAPLTDNWAHTAAKYVVENLVK